MRKEINWKIGYYGLLGVSLVIFVIMAWPFFFAELYASYDFFEVFIPERAFYSIALERGEIGLWIPHFWRGVDQIAYGQTGSFHPLHMVIYGCLSFPIAVAVEMVMHYPISFFGAYFFLRSSFGCEKTPAVFGASLFTFAVFPMAHFGHLHMCLIYAHIPWFCWAVERQVRGSKPFLSASVAGLLTASLLLLCHPQVAFLVLLTGGFLWLYLICIDWPIRFSVARSAMLAVALAGGVLVGMLQLYPTLNAFKTTNRSHLTEAERQNYSLPPQSLLTNLAPGLFGTIGPTDKVTLEGRQIRMQNPSEFSGYLGIGVLTLIWCYLCLGSDPKRLTSRSFAFATASFLVLLLMTLGRYGFVNRLLGVIPLVSQFRCPNRYKIVLSALVYLVATQCVRKLACVDVGDRSPSKREWMVFFPPTLSVLTVLVIAYLDTCGQLSGQWRWEVSLVWGPIVSVLVALGCLFHTRGKSWGLSVVMILCMVDLALFGIPKMKLGGYVSFDDVHNLKRRMSQPKMYRVVSHDNTPLWNGDYMGRGYLGMLPSEELNFGIAWHNQIASVKTHFPPDRGTLHIPSPVFPRFRLVSNLLPQPRPNIRECSPVDFEKTAWASGMQELCFTGDALSPNESVEVVVDGFSKIDLVVHVDQKRVLVCSDRWHRGWVCSVNDVVTPIIPLYGHSMRGVIVLKGKSRIVMTYQPPALAKGIGLATGGGVILVLLALVGVLDLKRNRFSEDAEDGLAKPEEKERVD